VKIWQDILSEDCPEEDYRKFLDALENKEIIETKVENKELPDKCPNTL